MAKSRSLQQAVRFALATATAAAGVSALHAQEAPAPAAAAAAPVEEVVVTGSRLSTPNETSISPITTVSAVDLQQTGLTRVEDVLNNLPMVFAGMNSTTSNGADGTASVDLRGLGNQRTLVLVDGLRLGPGSALGGRNYSDINQIPAALIERVDVLTGGASAVYGADAVAGVVNFILNTHFEGVRIDAGYHFNEHDNKDQDGVALAGHRGRRCAADGQCRHGLRQERLRSSWARTSRTTRATPPRTSPTTTRARRCRASSTTAPARWRWRAPLRSPAAAPARPKGGRFYASTPHGVSFIHHTVDCPDRHLREHRYARQCRHLQLRTAELLPDARPSAGRPARS